MICILFSLEGKIKKVMDIVPIKIDVGEGKAWDEVCGLSRSDTIWASALICTVIMADG
jgi:hypothetical protein